MDTGHLDSISKQDSFIRFKCVIIFNEVFLRLENIWDRALFTGSRLDYWAVLWGKCQWDFAKFHSVGRMPLPGPSLYNVKDTSNKDHN